VAIPTSFLMAFMILNGVGVALNEMIMFGMLLSVGILVDGAIIVVEYADRKMTEGIRPSSPSPKPPDACSGPWSPPPAP
jgi:multidrug efflux pump